MGIDLNFEIRRFAKNAVGGVARAMRGTAYESLAVAQVEPPGFELSRSGRRFYGGAQNGATGRAPTATLPTTAAPWLLFNGEPANGAAYAIERVTVAQLSGTAAVGGAILLAMTDAAITKPTAATGYASRCASGAGGASKAVWADNQTLALTPTVWLSPKANGNPASVTNGGDTIELVHSPIILPPGFALAIHYLSGTGTSPLFLAYAVWSEFEAADLE